MAQQVGSIYTRLSLEESSFVSGLKKSVDSAATSARAIDRSLNVIKTSVAGLAAGLVTGGLVSGFINAGQRALAFADDIGDAAKRIGVSASLLQEFRYAAEQTGSGFTTADAGLEKFVNLLGDAERGSEKAQKLLAALGVTSKDARTAFLQAADGAQKLASNNVQLSVATDLFGKKNSSLVDLLRQGSEGFSQLARDANSLGIVLSDQLVNNAGAANDKLAATKRILDAQFANFIGQNATAIVRLAEGFGRLAKNAFDFLRLTSGSRIRDALKDTGASDLYASTTAGRFEAQGSADYVAAAIADAKKNGPLSPAVILKAAQEGVAAWRKAMSTASTGGGLGGSLEIKDLAPKIKAAKAELDPFLESLKGMTLPDNLLEGMGATADLDDPLLLRRMGDDAKYLDAELAKLDEAGVAHINALGEAADKRAEDFQRMRQFADQAAASITSGFEDAIFAGKGLGSILKGLIEDIGRLAIRQAILKPISGGIANLLGGKGFGGFFANGGMLGAGKWGIAGEAGPEIIKGPAQIIPNGAMKGMGGGGMVMHIDARGSSNLAETEAAARRGAMAGLAMGADGLRRSQRPMLMGGLG